MSGAPPELVGDRFAPLAAAEFAQAMAALAPFEPVPHLAVAVSGGSDSMALALCAAAWARAEGGAITALTVDHGLRPEAADEAAQVARWCRARGIAHEILRWAPPPLTSGIQAAARRARYALLEDWCRAHQVLHLLVAHQREDQAETFLMRLLRSSGIEGLAAMSAVVERRDVRLLRPLLAVPRARLRATLAAAGQAWLEDPSNRDPAYLRTRLRRDFAALAEGGFSVARCAALAARFGRARMLLEGARAALLARAARIDPAGFVLLDREQLWAAPEEIGRSALAAVLTTVSGAEYAPRLQRLERLYQDLSQGRATGATLGGCRILPWRGQLVICREFSACAPAMPLPPGSQRRWDGRFEAVLDAAAPPGLVLGALGAAGGGATTAEDGMAAALTKIPAAARPSLPALCDKTGVLALPSFGYFSAGGVELLRAAVRMTYRPTRPLTGAGFRIV